MNFEFSFVTLQGFHIVWPSVLCLIITKPDTYPPLGRVLSSFSMQTTAMKCFFAQKFGLNLSEMERTLRIESNLGPVAGFSGKGKFNFSCACANPTRFLNKLRLELQSVFLIVCSPPRSFFRLNHLRLVRKRLAHPTFSSRKRFFYQNASLLLSHVRATIWLGKRYLNLIKFGFVRFR